jgi:hypothetical protein
MNANKVRKATAIAGTPDCTFGGFQCDFQPKEVVGRKLLYTFSKNLLWEYIFIEKKLYICYNFIS